MPAGKKGIESNKKKKEVKEFSILGIGASAGSLDAIRSFFETMPDQLSKKD